MTDLGHTFCLQTNVITQKLHSIRKSGIYVLMTMSNMHFHIICLCPKIGTTFFQVIFTIKEQGNIITNINILQLLLSKSIDHVFLFKSPEKTNVEKSSNIIQCNEVYRNLFGLRKLQTICPNLRLAHYLDNQLGL